jgi:hypothetical protein
MWPYLEGVFADNEVQMVILMQHHGVLLKRGHLDINRQAHRENTIWRWGGGNGDDAATSKEFQRVPAATKGQERHGTDSPWQPSEGTNPDATSISDSRTGRNTCWVFNHHPVCSSLQWQPEETNTALISLPRAVAGLSNCTLTVHSCDYFYQQIISFIWGSVFLLASL